MKKLLGCFLCVMLLVFGVSSVGAIVIDLTNTSSYDIYSFGDYPTGSDGSLWRVIESNPTGTGVYQPFLRYQASPVEIGMNTDFKPVPYDDKMPATIYTRSVLFADLGVVTIDTQDYWSFTLDFNEPGSPNRFLSFDTYNIYQGDNAFETDYLDLGTALFTSSDTVLTDYTLASSGSGKDDIEFLIPILIDPTQDYMYLYIQSGDYIGEGDAVDQMYPEGRDWTAQAGFEEVRTTGIPSVPEPATMLLLGSGLVGLVGFRRKKFKK